MEGEPGCGDSSCDHGEFKTAEAVVIPFFGVGGFKVGFEALGVFDAWIRQYFPPTAGVVYMAEGWMRLGTGLCVCRRATRSGSGDGHGNDTPARAVADTAAPLRYVVGGM